MILRTIITGVLSVCAFFLTMRYNLHMFQLNGYKNKEQKSWLKKNFRRQWVLPVGIAIGILRMFLPHFAVDVLVWLWLILIFLVYHLLKKQPAKKKLVYTARVKRLIASDVALSALFAVLGSLLFGEISQKGAVAELGGFFLLVAAFQFWALIVANTVNKPIEKGVNIYYIKDAKKMLEGAPNLAVIGVTGSYGKTSVKFYLQTLLREKYNVLVTPESYNTPMGVVKTIRESLKSTHEIFICEMGARYVGDIKEICDIVHPMHGIITSIGPQHLETFQGMENIKKTKFELADALPQGGLLFLNGDSEFVREKASEEAYREKQPIFYFTEKGSTPFDGGAARAACAGYYAKDVNVSQLGTSFTVVSPKGEEEKFSTKLVGAHNVINVVGAIAVANTLGISLKDLKIPVRRIMPVKHRLEMIERGEVTIIDDAYNSNPVGSKAAVETLAMFEGVRILVTPGMVELGEKQEEYNYKFGTYAAGCCDYILLVGAKNTAPIRKGALEKGFSEEKCRTFEKLADALNFAYAVKEPGHKYILLENDLPDNYL